MPVVMVSSLTERGAEVTLDALSMGAVDFVAKPEIDVAGTLRDYSEELCAKVRMAARGPVFGRTRAARWPLEWPTALRRSTEQTRFWLRAVRSSTCAPPIA
jgi:two-component system chemotaxis response regulator CheB